MAQVVVTEPTADDDAFDRRCPSGDEQRRVALGFGHATLAVDEHSGVDGVTCVEHVVVMGDAVAVRRAGVILVGDEVDVGRRVRTRGADGSNATHGVVSVAGGIVVRVEPLAHSTRERVERCGRHHADQRRGEHEAVTKELRCAGVIEFVFLHLANVAVAVGVIGVLDRVAFSGLTGGVHDAVIAAPVVILQLGDRDGPAADGFLDMGDRVVVTHRGGTVTLAVGHLGRTGLAIGDDEVDRETHPRVADVGIPERRGVRGAVVAADVVATWGCSAVVELGGI